MRYFVHLAYKGTAYNGWQRQQNAPSVQQTLEDAFSRLLRCECLLTGCGRTDAGVHSSSYYAHFNYDGDREMDNDFIYHLNCCLPRDIAVFSVKPTELHARFDAVRREYKYFISRRKDVFRAEESWTLTAPLNEEWMRQASASLLQYSDFTSFAKLHSDNKTNVCRIYRADWEFSDLQYVFTISADRFLRGMVRAIVGTLVDVGRERITPDAFCAIIEALDRAAASSAAPPGGLFLTDIVY